MNANRKAIAFMSMQQNGMRISVSRVSNGTWERKIMNKGNKIGARILKRIILLAVVMFLLSVVVFWMARLAPGDPLQSFYGDSLEMMTSEEIAAARTMLGLESGNCVQYVKWLTNAVHGEFGLSLKYRQPGHECDKTADREYSGTGGSRLCSDLYAGNPDRNILYSS